MIPRIQKAGSSFVGAGRYYLHDKLKEGDKERSRDLETQTDERVWFTDTRNLMATDPERAFVEMWKTAEDQQWLKRQAGGKTCGRVCEESVKTLSLAWHKDDNPTPEHMVEAADAFIRHMGWQEHQAVYVGHDDTEHKHIHIILNRVHPETGKTLDDFREYKRAQEWALTYEKEHEQVRCVERELRAAEREQRAPDFGRDDERTRNPPEPNPANEHLPHNVVMLARPHERAFESEEQQRAELFAAERDELKAEQRQEREAWFRDGKELFKETRHAVYDEVRKEYAGEWRDYYRDAKDAEREAEAWSRNAVTRALYFAKEGRWDEMSSAYGEHDSVREHIDKQLALRKAELIERQNDDLRTRQKEACDELRLTREADYKQLLQRQRIERAAMKAAHVQEHSADFVLEARHERGEAEVQAGAANENVIARGGDVAPPSPDKQAITIQREHTDALSHHAADIARDQPSTFVGETGIAPEPSSEREPRRGLSDLAAGAIGSAAGYLADQLGDLFAPTPPELREELAKEQAKREADKPAAPEIPAHDPWQRQIEAALREAERLKEEQRSRDYWTERDRGKDWERDPIFPRVAPTSGAPAGQMDRSSHPPPFFHYRANRKAAELRKAERDPIRVARRAVVGVHKTQRQLQLASDKGERQQLMAALSAEAAARRKAVFAAISARYAAQRLLINPALTASARAAELARLGAEEQAELQQAEQRELLADRRFRRERLAALAAGQKLRRRLMALRQRHERAMFAVLLHGFRPRPPPHHGDDRGPGPATTTQRQGCWGRKPTTPRRR